MRNNARYRKRLLKSTEIQNNYLFRNFWISNIESV